MRGRGLRLIDGVVGLLVVLIVVFIVAGPISDHPAPTLEQVGKKADKVCQDVEVQQTRASARIFHGASGPQIPPRKWTRYARTILPGLESQLESIRGLDVPKGNERRFRAYYAALGQEIAIFKKVAASPRNLGVLRRNDAVFARADDLAIGLGLRRCGHAED